MKANIILLAVFIVFNLAACTSAKERKDEAQADYTEEKTKTLKDYKECVSDSSGEESKLAKCDALLKAVSAMEGGDVDNAKPVSVPESLPAPATSSEPGASK